MASISSRAVEAVEKARETAHSWNRVATFLQANPDIAENTYQRDMSYALVCLTNEPHAVALIADFAYRASEAGAQLKADISDEYAGLQASFGSVYLKFYAETERVCDPVTVSTPKLVGPLAVLVREWPGHSVGVEPVTDEIRKADPSISADARFAVVERTEGRFGKVCTTDRGKTIAGDLERTARAFASAYGATYLPREGEVS